MRVARYINRICHNSHFLTSPVPGRLLQVVVASARVERVDLAALDVPVDIRVGMLRPKYTF